MSWFNSSIIYHMFPLGLCGALGASKTDNLQPRIKRITDWLLPIKELGCNTILLGPFWESVDHGYDTTDYTKLDVRLGSNQDLKDVLVKCKAEGFRLVFDGVFNHCGRQFPPFIDLKSKGQESKFKDWFAGIDFSKKNELGDPFDYQGWNGHKNLVKFNLINPEVQAFLFSVVDQWIDEYDLDGLRLDAADVIDKDFLRKLSQHCKGKKNDFWLMGEVVHGDYSSWAPGAGLDSVTNYEAYKGFWSSLKDGNYFEIAWTLNRLFGVQGICKGTRLYNFADNHDVDRVASSLENNAHLYPLYLLLFTAPGIPSIYYGSEVGLQGKRTATSDKALRPELNVSMLSQGPEIQLAKAILQFSKLKQTVPALLGTGYSQILVQMKQLVFKRFDDHGTEALVLINSDAKPVTVKLPIEGNYTDVLNQGFYTSQAGTLTIDIPACWGRVLIH